MRVIAVDWSGRQNGARNFIWLAEAADNRLERLESGRNREEIADYLVAEAARDPEMVVGLDFAFSLPSWFLGERGFDNAPALWSYLADGAAEDWLARCEPPFWGQPGRQRPVLDAESDHYRRTEREAEQVTGFRPKSVFQIGGAGAVGTGSLRGMPVLHSLRESGFHVSPFDAPDFPLIVEIYPRLLTGAVNKSSLEARASYLGAHHSTLDRQLFMRAASSEDAFDAAISALVMSRHTDDVRTLPEMEDQISQLEGVIWHPLWRESRPRSHRR